MAKEINAGDTVTCGFGIYGEDSFSVNDVVVLAVKNNGFFLVQEPNARDLVIYAKIFNWPEADLICIQAAWLNGAGVEATARNWGFEL